MQNKLTPADIEAAIASVRYQQPLKPENPSTITVCIITLKNGYEVVGTSACADPAQYDAEIGKEWARKDAVNKIWPLEGYLLKQRLFEASQENAK